MEMGEDTLALEVAPDFALSFTKGCYVGQEIVARGTYVGQVRRKLFGLRVDADLPPVHGDKVSKGTREVGNVTSGTWSPRRIRFSSIAEAGTCGRGFTRFRSSPAPHESGGGRAS